MVNYKCSFFKLSEYRSQCTQLMKVLGGGSKNRNISAMKSKILIKVDRGRPGIQFLNLWTPPSILLIICTWPWFILISSKFMLIFHYSSPSPMAWTIWWAGRTLTIMIGGGWNKNRTKKNYQLTHFDIGMLMYGNIKLYRCKWSKFDKHMHSISILRFALTAHNEKKRKV